MTGWKWQTFDAVTNASRGYVQVSSWDHEDRLSNAGSFSGALSIGGNPDLDRNTLNATTDNGSKMIIPFRQDSPLYTGWIPPGGRTGNKITGAGLLSYFDTRFIRATVTYTALDQFLLQASLINTAQVGVGAGIGIDTSQVGTSGVLRTQTWNASDGKNVGEALRQMSKLLNGFDFDIRTEIDVGQLIRRLRCWYPYRGLSQGGPVFRLGRGGNMLSIPVLTGRRNPTAVFALGVETDSVNHIRLSWWEESATRVAEGLPIIEAGLNLSDISVLGTLQNQVRGRLADAGDDEIELDINPNDKTWPWGSWDLGSYCQLVIPPRTPMWPDGLYEQRRIVSHKWHYDVAGERLKVVVGRIPT